MGLLQRIIISITQMNDMEMYENDTLEKCHFTRYDILLMH